jgi:hypothetical protein
MRGAIFALMATIAFQATDVLASQPAREEDPLYLRWLGGREMFVKQRDDWLAMKNALFTVKNYIEKNH